MASWANDRTESKSACWSRGIELRKQVPAGPGRVAHEGEVLAGRVEIHDEEIGVVEPIDAAQPGMQAEGTEVGEVDQRRLRVAHRQVLPLAPRLLHPHGGHPVRKVLRHLLLVEAVGRDPVREPLQDEGVVTQPRQDVIRNRIVVVDDLALGDAVVGEQHLVLVRRVDRVASEAPLAHRPPLRRAPLAPARDARPPRPCLF
jgi:hypothetical protein